MQNIMMFLAISVCTITILSFGYTAGKFSESNNKGKEGFDIYHISKDDMNDMINRLLEK